MSEDLSHYIISLTSQDRIGIVYDVSSVLAELHGNIAESSQTVMSGYYTLIMRVTFPAVVPQSEIVSRLEDLNAHSSTVINIMVNRLEPSSIHAASPGNIYVLTASGPDHIGFVAEVSGFCAQHQINIIDLSTLQSNGEFVMMLEVDLKNCSSMNELRNQLTLFGQVHHLNVVLQHKDIFRAVNEIRLPRPEREK